MIRKLLVWPKDDAALRQKSKEVDPDAIGSSQMVAELVMDLFDTMYEHEGVGISAIQIGVPYRVFVMEVHGKDYVFVNPRITATGGEYRETNEGCLSFPGIIELVRRHDVVTVEGLDRDLNPIKLSFAGIEAQCVQHETEHLDGVILADKVTPTRRDIMRKKLKKVKEAE